MTRSEVDQLIRPPQLIIGAMAIGVVAFGVIAIVLATGKDADQADAESANLLLLVLMMMVVGEVPAFFLVRAALMRQARDWWAGQDGKSEPPLEPLVQRFTMITIIGGALTDGAALFGILIYMLSGATLAFAAPALGLLAFAQLFPTRTRFNNFVAGVTGLPWDGTR